MFGFVVLMASFACGPVSTPKAAIRRGTPHYEGNLARVFDDSVAPSAAGFPGASDEDPAHDTTFAPRVQLADYILSARLVTTESPPAGGHTVTFKTLEKLSGKYNPPATFKIDLSPDNPYNKLLDVPHSPLLTKPLIILVKEFVAGEEVVRHVHIQPDTNEVRMAVASLLARS